MKKILIFIVGLIALFLIFAIFLPSSYQVKRSTTINAPVETVFNNVADFNNYLHWNPWSKMDPEAKNSISGNGNQVGDSWTWDGQVVGKGSLTYVEINALQSIKSKLVFTAPREDTADDLWEFEKNGNITNVVWTLKGELAYPIGRFMGFFLDDMLGKDMENGLQNLKEYSEK